MKKTILGIAVGIAAIMSSESKAAFTFDAATQFSAASNPNVGPLGVWTYGYETTLGSNFNPYTDSSVSSNINFWGISGIGLPPVVGYNATSTTQVWGTGQFVPGQLGLHPGPNGEVSIVRFTVPGTDTYLLSALFSGIDINPPGNWTNTGVHVLLNNSPLFNGVVNGDGPASNQPYATSLTLNKGDTVDFAVGFGPLSQYFYGSTGLSATLTSSSFNPVPEPSNLVLLSLGGLSSAFIYRRHRRKLAQA